MKTLEELRPIIMEITDRINQEQLSMEEALYVMENVRTFILASKIVLDFDDLKKLFEKMRAAKPR